VDASGFLRHLLDPDRLAVAGLVAARARTVKEIAAETGQPPKAVLTTLAPLVQAGIVVREGEHYTLRRDALRELAQDLPRPTPDPEVMDGMSEGEQAVLSRFFRGDKLVDIPVRRTPRRIVLERIAQDFEPGRHYDELEVNATLSARHPDHAALRRYLVEEGFLDRDGREYWRSGGRV
jgi:hypothetical protein